MSETRPAGALHTDLGNAERMVFRNKHQMRYVPGWGWMVFNGKHWERDLSGAVERMAKDTVRALYAEAEGLDSETDRIALIKHALKSERAPAIKAMIELARTEPGIAAKPDDFNVDHYKLNVLNGTIDLRTQTLGKHRREDLITMLAPVTYDAEATAPRWEAFMLSVMAQRFELVAFMQRVIGYTMTGATGEQALFFLHGDGANGKGALMRTLKALLGTYFAQIDFSSLQETQKSGSGASPDLVRLIGKRAVSARESGASRKIDEGLVKAITGQDPIVARPLYHEPIEYLPCFKMWWSSNERPTIAGTDYGIWRRLLLIPFDVKFSEHERDPELEPALQGPELSGILNWALKGCAQWQKMRLAPPEVVQSATTAYRVEQDTFAEFLANQCEIDGAATESAAVLLKHFNAELPRHEQITAKKLAAELKRRDFKSVRNATGVRWIGVRIRRENAENVGSPPVSVGSEATFSKVPFENSHKGFLELTTQPTHATQSSELLCVGCRKVSLSAPGKRCYSCQKNSGQAPEVLEFAPIDENDWAQYAEDAA